LKYPGALDHNKPVHAIVCQKRYSALLVVISLGSKFLMAADVMTPDLAKCNTTLLTVIAPVKTEKRIREATVKLFLLSSYQYMPGLEYILMT